MWGLELAERGQCRSQHKSDLWMPMVVVKCLHLMYFHFLGCAKYIYVLFNSFITSLFPSRHLKGWWLTLAIGWEDNHETDRVDGRVSRVAHRNCTRFRVLLVLTRPANEMSSRRMYHVLPYSSGTMYLYSEYIITFAFSWPTKPGDHQRQGSGVLHICMHTRMSLFRGTCTALLSATGYCSTALELMLLFSIFVYGRYHP